MNKTIILVLLLAGLSPCGVLISTANAAPGPAPGKAPMPPKRYKSESAATKVKSRRQTVLNERAAKAEQNLNEFMGQLNQQARIAGQLGNRFVVPQTKEFAERAHELMRDKANAERARTVFKAQTVQDYAAANNIVILRSPPNYAPPVLSYQLGVPAGKVRPAKSALPPRSNTPLLQASNPGPSRR